MIDIRIYESKADELIALDKPLIFKKIINTGCLVERHISRVNQTYSSPIVYNNKRMLYKPNRDYRVPSVDEADYSKLNCISKENLYPYTDTTIKSHIVDLLKMGYAVYY